MQLVAFALLLAVAGCAASVRLECRGERVECVLDNQRTVSL